MKLIIVPNGEKSANENVLSWLVCLPSDNWEGSGNFPASPVSSHVASASTNNSICCPEMEKLRAIQQTNHAAPIPIFPNM